MRNKFENGIESLKRKGPFRTSCLLEQAQREYHHTFGYHSRACGQRGGTKFPNDPRLLFANQQQAVDNTISTPPTQIKAHRTNGSTLVDQLI